MASVLELPEGLLRSNEPLLLYVLPDGIEVKTALLPSDKAETWAEKARELDDLDFKISLIGERLRKSIEFINTGTLANAKPLETRAEKFRKEARKVQAERYRRLKTLLTEYDGKAFCEAVVAESTAAQIVGAFERLKMYNDPFVVSEALQQEAMRAALKAMRSQNSGVTN